MIKIGDVILCALRCRHWDKETKLRQVVMLTRLRLKADRILAALQDKESKIIEATASAIDEVEKEFNIKRLGEIKRLIE